MILCKVIRDTLQSNTYYLGKYHVLCLFLTSKSRNSAVVIVCSKKF